VEADLTDQLALGIVPEACSDTIRRKLWARWPAEGGRYLLEITLLDDHDSTLDTSRTPPFEVSEH
jgi:hypothetical protein